jgi:hypothetical protein
VAALRYCPAPVRRRRRTRRTAAAALAAACVLGALAAAALAAAAAKPVSPANATAVATAVNLRHSDVPTLKAQSNPITAQQRQQNAKLSACIGESPPSKLLADVQSQDFVGPSPDTLTISSETQIEPTVSAVTNDLAAIHRPLALSCLQSGLSKVLATSAPKGSTYTLSIARLAATLPGTSGVAAVRVTATFHVKDGSKTVTVPAYIDDLGFAYGQAEISLNVISTLQPPSATLETKLALTLIARAHAALG